MTVRLLIFISVAAVAIYLIGGVPFGLIVGRLGGVDV